MLLLQHVPHYTAGISPTTCRHLQCPCEAAIFKGGDFILILGKTRALQPNKKSLELQGSRVSLGGPSISKILHCWKGKYRSCILADEMGLGKTIQALTACMQHKATTLASFSLVITTKSCVRQWADQIHQHLNEAKRPRYLVLDSSKPGAVDIINGNYDLVICSYDFVQAQHRRLLAHQDFQAWAGGAWRGTMARFLLRISVSRNSQARFSL